jgi:hypothetical protein
MSGLLRSDRQRRGWEGGGQRSHQAVRGPTKPPLGKQPGLIGENARSLAMPAVGPGELNGSSRAIPGRECPKAYNSGG